MSCNLLNGRTSTNLCAFTSGVSLGNNLKKCVFDSNHRVCAGPTPIVSPGAA